MRRVNISITDEVYEALRKLAFEERIQVGTLVKRVVEGGILIHGLPLWTIDHPVGVKTKRLKPISKNSLEVVEIEIGELKP